MVDEFARAVLSHGTTAIVSDPHEIANVLGTDGVHWLLDVCEELPLDVFVMASSCVPASPFESPRRPLIAGRHGVDPAPPSRARRRRDDELPRRHRRRPGRAGEARAARARRTPTATRPGVRGARRSTPTSPPASAPTTRRSRYEEALEKRREGLWVLIREASNARNLRRPAAARARVRARATARSAPTTASRTSWCARGTSTRCAASRSSNGIAPEDALLLATLHPARCHGLDDAGAIAPGFRADLVLLPDLESFRADRVWKDGVQVVDGGRRCRLPRIEVPRVGAADGARRAGRPARTCGMPSARRLACA